MDTCWQFPCLLVLILLVVPFCRCQSSVAMTEPTLTDVVAVNSTALTVNWQFANSSIDQSDLIRVYITILEYFTNYITASYVANYTFTTNKTITSWTQNFPLVNALYSVCFSSNSTKTNATQFLAITRCRLARTCLRQNSSVCPTASPATIIASEVSSTSFLVTVNWLNISAYSPNSTLVQLANENTTGTLVSSTSNGTYTSQAYRFSSRQPRTNYTVNTILTYTISNQLKTDAFNLTVTTSRSPNCFAASDLLIFGAAALLAVFRITFH